MSQDYRSNELPAKRNYQEIKVRALRIRELFGRQNIQFHAASAIGILLRDAEALSDNFIAGQYGASKFKIFSTL